MNLQLLKDCQKGDRKAQFKLYRLCYPTLMRVCLRYQRNEDEAAAALNTGFLKILKNLDKFSGKASFEGWIKRIMINTMIDEFRKNRKVRELMEYTDFSDSHHINSKVNYNEADEQFDAEELEILIQALPPMSRKVFNLYAIDGYRHKEIGKMLNISDGTSKWHLSFARKKLREWIQEKMKKKNVG